MSRYDAGDTLKFIFPMAYATSILALGYLEVPETYQANPQREAALLKNIQ